MYLLPRALHGFTVSSVPPIKHDSNYWRDLARGARAIANETSNPLIRRQMLQTAEEYDALAKLKEEQNRGQ